MQTILALSLALFVPTDIVVQICCCISWENALEKFFLRCSHAICVSISKETITHCRVKSHVWWSYTTWTLFTQLTESPPVPQQSWGLLILSSVEHSSRRQMWKCWIFWDLVYLIPACRGDPWERAPCLNQWSPGKSAVWFFIISTEGTSSGDKVIIGKPILKFWKQNVPCLSLPNPDLVRQTFWDILSQNHCTIGQGLIGVSL